MNIFKSLVATLATVLVLGGAVYTTATAASKATPVQSTKKTTNKIPSLYSRLIQNQIGPLQ
ncbi:hypothetical protein [Lactiplantibacillus pentosus]|jgi:hypothetical protein|uniref:hypothetical protein n=1 Tax=Lactiplantibacillus pentosus TaxID=1589 RepID=UPI00031D8B14|nr:hypothetical protein [Lactiplantibacillus pentosus]ASG79929.1 hypothetical protein CEW82_08745 [Lactiplantibacillus pentosus]MCS8604481.1 hypothetical protein [Lactiplantibacillus pentosus]PRO86936.1 hypothetical protein C6Y10_00405 [Lactiplantibacillus pentosus]